MAGTRSHTTRQRRSIMLRLRVITRRATTLRRFRCRSVTAVAVTMVETVATIVVIADTVDIADTATIA